METGVLTMNVGNGDLARVLCADVGFGGVTLYMRSVMLGIGNIYLERTDLVDIDRVVDILNCGIIAVIPIVRQLSETEMIYHESL